MSEDWNPGGNIQQKIQSQDSYISQSISQLDHQNVYAHVGQCRVDSDIEGAARDGLEIEDLQILLSPQNEMNQNGRVAIHESAPEHPEISLNDMCHADMAMTEFLIKLDEEVLSIADLSDFIGLEGKRKTVWRYNFPLSLIPTVERINDACGDVSATSLINLRAAETIFVLFCATIKEMDDLQLEHVTEKKMFKWRIQ